MPPKRKTAEPGDDPKKRQKPASAVKELVQENQDKTAKRTRGSVEQQKKADVSSPLVARRTKRKTEQPHHVMTDGEETNQPSLQGLTVKAEKSVAEVAELVKKLNAEIEQAARLMTDSFTYRRLPAGSGSNLDMALNQENQDKTAKRTRGSVEQQKKAAISSPLVARRITRKMKTKQPHHVMTDGEQTNQPSLQGFAVKADNISVAEVAELVKKLNAEIEQASRLMTDSLTYRRLPSSGSNLDMALNELHDYLGAQLCNELQRRSNKPCMEPDPLVTQITLQTGLVNTCSRIINDRNYPFWVKDSMFSRIISNMERRDQVVADMWKAQTRTYMTVSLDENQEVNKKYLTGMLLKLTTAVGGSLQSGDALPSQCDAKLEDIVRQAVELQKIISKDATPMGVTYTIPCDEEFDPSQMEDMKWDGGEIATVPFSRVICTVEMGLRCRKRVDSGSEVGEELGVEVKPKVVLAATLEACSTALEKAKVIKQLEAQVAELYQLLQKNAEKLSSMELEVNQRNADHARDFERLEARLNQLLQTKTTELWGTESTANGCVHVLSDTSQTQGVEKRQATTGLPQISMEGEQTHAAFVRKADSISVVEVADLVKMLNSQIEQVSMLVTNSLSYKETPSSGKGVRIALGDHVGQWLYNSLQSRSERKMEPDPLIMQVAIQTALANACCRIINGSPLSRMYSDAEEADQGATDAVRALAHSHSMTLFQSEHTEAIQKYLIELLLELITAAGGSLETLQSQYGEKVEDIAKRAIKLHWVVSQDVTSVELTTYTIPCNTDFDPSQMEDTERQENMTVSIPQGKVVCTVEMGLRCRKKFAQAKQNGSGGGRDVTMKAQVVLASTLEAEIPN